METTKQKHPKKVLHASLMARLQPMLHDVKETFIVNEHKLEKLVKSAASYLADHLHIGDAKTKKVIARKKAVMTKKVEAVKKAVVKKAAPKNKVAKKIPAKK